MNPSFIRLTFTSLPALYAARNSGDTSAPHPFRARRSSSTDKPSDSHRGTRWSLAPNVNVCASSCQNVEPQLKSPASRAAAESIETHRANREVCVAPVYLEPDRRRWLVLIARRERVVRSLREIAQIRR